MYKNLVKLIIILLFFTANVLAESFSKYNVTGNQRVSEETIINFSKLKKNVEISKNDLNNALKNIYDSNFFDEVSIEISDNTLNINVKERFFLFLRALSPYFAIGRMPLCLCTS